ncbi:serine/threonine protein kinase [Mycolicibacterium goodii]|uniref:serine/threonine-protein kinase n=1 Tax=Mycolicibacterium goodii TaxID=134601 RepID=UPI001BDD18D9|nr:serine/threonine-protein kinase [Mycolicibacterium goodii]MBU8820407.1 serine/threonine protein kinase [Mycolicibacterium goodii]
MDLTEIAGYAVLRQLGSGGMGQVFLVQHPRLPRQDALKLLDAGISRNDDFKVRFQREADLLAQLSHPNIVTLHDRGEFQGRLWITMEFIDGTDAAELLKADGALDPDLALSLIAGAGAALDYAWRKKRITHRDVKPANILVGIDETDGTSQIESVKLADFGIAKAAGEATSLTSTGMTIGTMQYISPEAIEGEDVDNRSDIYSLGCTAFHLLAGQPPFTGNSIASTMSAHLTKPVPPIGAANPHLPKSMDTVFERVLAKDPRDRYESCAEFVTALQEAGGGEVRYPAFAQTLPAPTSQSRTTVNPEAPTQQRKNAEKAAAHSKPRNSRALVAAAAVIVLAAAALLGLYVTRESRHDAPASPSSRPTATTTLAPPPPAPAVTTPEYPSTTPTTVIVAPPSAPAPSTTATPSPSIVAAMPCDRPGTQSADGRFACDGLNGIWVDRYAPPMPTISWDAIGQPCTSPGAKARLEASDGVLTCTPTSGGAYVWVAGPY